MIGTIAKSVLLGLTLGAALAFAASPTILDHRPASNGSPALIPATAIVGPPNRSLTQYGSAIDPSDPEDVGCPRCAERNPRCDDHPLPGFGNSLAMGNSHRLLHHVTEILDISGVYAMCAPQDREPPGGSEVRGQHQDRGLGRSRAARKAVAPDVV